MKKEKEPSLQEIWDKKKNSPYFPINPLEATTKKTSTEIHHSGDSSIDFAVGASVCPLLAGLM